MKSYTMFVCEKCGKQSKDSKEILKCEASHYGLTVEQMKEWENLKDDVRNSGVGRTSNKYTRISFDTAMNELLKFEKEHGLTE